MRASGVLFCGGGTGGHVFPGLAVAAACRQQGLTDQRWIGDPERLEAKLVPPEGITLLPIGLSRPRIKSLRWWVRALRVLWACVQELRRRPPQVVVALGGYAALIPGLLAPWLRRPLVVLEQNALPGRTNRLLAKRATVIVSQFAEARRYLPADKVQQLGNPVRAFQRMPRGQQAGLRVLAMGGSLAAKSLNDCLVAAAPALAQLEGIHVIHLAGKDDHERVAAAYQACGLSAEVFGYVDDMASLYARVDLALCRSGATSVAECCVAGLGAIYIPLPWAAEDHQTHNARAVARIGGAVVLPQPYLNAPSLVHLLQRFAAEPALCQRFADHAHTLARPQAAADVVHLLRRLGLRA